MLYESACSTRVAAQPVVGSRVARAAGATVGSVAISGSVSPAPVSAASTPVSLSLSYDSTCSSGFSPGVQRLTFHFDDDLAFDTTGIPQCSLASITNASRAAALAACPGSVVGSGDTVCYAGEFIYNDATTRSASAMQTCWSTGERASALKSCRKRAHKHNWSHKRVRRCKKNAKLLPV